MLRILRVHEGYTDAVEIADPIRRNAADAGDPTMGGVTEGSSVGERSDSVRLVEADCLF